VDHHRNPKSQTLVHYFRTFSRTKNLPTHNTPTRDKHRGIQGNDIRTRRRILSQSRNDGKTVQVLPTVLNPRGRASVSIPIIPSALQPVLAKPSQTVTLAYKTAGDAWKLQRLHVQECSSRNLKNGEGQSAFPKRNGEAPGK
jgi:hypothetical protein